MAYVLSWMLPASPAGLLIWTMVLAVVLQVLLKLLKKWKQEASLQAFPKPPGHWLMGNAPQVMDLVQGPVNSVKFQRIYGSPYRLRMGPFRNAVILADPDSIRTMLSTNEPKEPEVHNMLGPWIGDGLILSKGKKWMRNRRLLTPAFHFQILRPYVKVFSDSTHIMMNKWRELLKDGPQRMEMFDHLSLMIFDSLLKCAFGCEETIQLEGKKNQYINSVYAATELVMTRLTNPLVYSDFAYFLTKNGSRFREACGVIHQYSESVIKSRKKSKQNKDETHQKKYLDFLDILLEAKDNDGSGLTDKEIQHEVDTFMFAGHDTTASALSWFLYNMARHPEHQKKCAEEIESVLEDRDEVTWDNLSNFEYLTMCLKESMRTHTTVPILSRRTTVPLTLPNGVIVPEDTWVIMNIFCLHHNADVWEDPGKYDPLRFTTENSTGRSPHAFVPFAAGSRNCIGQNFALSELKTCAALLLKHFEFEEQEEPIPSQQLVLRAKNGIYLKVKERTVDRG